MRRDCKFQNPPFDTFDRGPNGTFKTSGVATNTVNWMAEYYNFKYVRRDISQSHILIAALHYLTICS